MISLAMKRKPNYSLRRSAGFTLVELLVVIVIIATLAGLGLTMTSKMRKRGQAAKSVMNMRQIGPLLMTYATEHSFQLPRMRPVIPDGKGGVSEGLHWHQALVSQLFPDTDVAKFKDDKWWEETKPLLRNPLFTKSLAPLTLPHWHQGYAMNSRIMSNLGHNGDWASVDGPNAKDIPLASIPEPAKTPLSAPRVTDWHYAGADLGAINNKGFVVDDKLPILFVDGHIENMRPSEYISRKLDDIPPPPP